MKPIYTARGFNVIDKGHGPMVAIKHPGAVIIPHFTNGDLILVRQFRPTLGCDTLEFPRGAAKPGEHQVACAARELLEETGYHVKHDNLRLLGHVAPDNGFIVTELPIFEAVLDDNDKAGEHDDEIQSVLRLSPHAVEGLIRMGTITDSLTLSAMLFWTYFCKPVPVDAGSYYIVAERRNLVVPVLGPFINPDVARPFLTAAQAWLAREYPGEDLEPRTVPYCWGGQGGRANAELLDKTNWIEGVPH